MYNPVLDTFVAVVRAGSFSKAAGGLFMSAVSVMKQMNHFETEMGVKIFERTTRGVTLTAAGQALYASAQKIMNGSQMAVAQARTLDRHDQTVIRIATSLLRSAQPIITAWEQLKLDKSAYQLQIIPFNDDAESLRHVTGQLGKTVDLLVGPTNANYLMANTFDFFNLGDRKCDVMVPSSSDLAQKDALTWADLDGQTLLLIRRGLSPRIDELRDEVLQQHPEITVVSTSHFYDMDAFNTSATRGYVMESLDLWQGVHPSMVSRPMAWDYTISYGILSASEAATNVKEFVSLVGQQYLATH